MKEWYIYEDDEVVGPFEGPELADHIDPDTLVCPAGSDEWKKASERSEVRPFLSPDDSEETNEPDTSKNEASPDEKDVQTTDEDVEAGELEPTLNNLERIAREASAEELKREFQHYWDDYDRKEQQIIYREMKHLDIVPDDSSS